MQDKHVLKRRPAAVAASLLTLVVVALAGCASSMAPRNTWESDSRTTSAVQKSLESNENVNAGQVGVETREGVVYLTGVVQTEAARREAARVAWRMEGVDGVENELTVGERTVGGQIDDVMISSTVKSKLIASSEIRAGDIGVSSSQGVVTLIGRVSSQLIRSDAERIAGGTSGVSGVNNELLVGQIKR